MTSRYASLSKIYLCVPLSHVRCLPSYLMAWFSELDTCENDNFPACTTTGFFLQWSHANDALKTYYSDSTTSFPYSGERKKDAHISGWFKSWISGEFSEGEQNTFLPLRSILFPNPAFIVLKSVPISSRFWQYMIYQFIFHVGRFIFPHRLFISVFCYCWERLPLETVTQMPLWITTTATAK